MHVYTQQLIHFFAALLVLLSFSMLTQRRMLNLIRLLALQGLVLAIDVALVAYFTHQPELYISAILSLILKVWFIPFILHRMLIGLGIRGKIEPMVNTSITLLIGLGLVIFAFNLSLPISASSTVTSPGTLGMALASVLLSSFMMIIKRKAISQVVALLALENSLFFVASSSAYSMPLVVELGIAFDVLIGLFIFGVFFLQIRDTFDNFDLKHMEQLREK